MEPIRLKPEATYELKPEATYDRSLNGRALDEVLRDWTLPVRA